jgi:histidinol-phosphatase (PHP family)
MREIAGSGRALELNIGGPLRPWIPQWWSEEGGRAITFASDVHTTDALAGNFYEAMAMAERFGFRQGRHQGHFWTADSASVEGPLRITGVWRLIRFRV